MTKEPAVIEVSARDLRERFRLGRYEDRVRSGELKALVLSEGHPSPVGSGQPFCTRSQILGYEDVTRRRVALVHQYLRPDGTLGGSGHPDPKRIFEDGAIYAVMKP